MAGVERSDSVMWDPHKMLGSILQCAMLLTPHVSMVSFSPHSPTNYTCIGENIPTIVLILKSEFSFAFCPDYFVIGKQQQSL